MLSSAEVYAQPSELVLFVDAPLIVATTSVLKPLFTISGSYFTLLVEAALATKLVTRQAAMHAVNAQQSVFFEIFLIENFFESKKIPPFPDKFTAEKNKRQCS